MKRAWKKNARGLSRGVSWHPYVTSSGSSGRIGR